MLRYVRHLMTKGCHGVSPSFLVYLLASQGTSSSRFISQGFTILPYPLHFTESLTESVSVSQAANANSSSTMNKSALLKMNSASAKIASVLSSAVLFLNWFNGQFNPLHVSYKLRYSRILAPPYKVIQSVVVSLVSVS